MARFISLLIERSHQRLMAFALWLVVFLLTLGIASGLAVHQIGQSMQNEAKLLLDPLLRLRVSVASTLEEMDRRLTAAPCSPEFHEQLRAIAFLPDGLNEFLYAPNGEAQCSVALDFEPVSLGAADIGTESLTTSLWLDRNLDFMGLPGQIGTIALRGDFAVVIPPQRFPELSTHWMRHEVVAVAPDGRYWHRHGERGIFDREQAAGSLGTWLPIRNGAFYSRVCDPAGIHCVATEASLGAMLSTGWIFLAAGIVICGLLALGIAQQFHEMLRRYWAFEARFRRNFTQDSIICTYQPILSLSTGTISGCEVLVRWRDIDGTVVFPDQFLPIVAKHGLGRQLTAFVVQRAYQELAKHVPANVRLQVNFNVFPTDFDAAWLRDALVIFENTGNRFSIVVEIVESDEVDIAHTQREVEALRRYGYRTHLDDFGTGYSNIQNLATLGVDGVKLDRSFAMAAEGTMMSKMLLNAIDMVHAAGHRITVEGVETEDRLAAVKATGQVEFVQGYLISRPLDIERFVQFLGEQGVPMGQRPRLVA